MSFLNAQVRKPEGIQTKTVALYDAKQRCRRRIRPSGSEVGSGLETDFGTSLPEQAFAFGGGV